MTTDEFIGAEFRRKYEDIWPIIRLVMYRIDVNRKNGIIYYDGVWPGREPVRYIALKPVRAIIYNIKKIFSTKHIEDSIYLSDTILCSDRYPGLLEELYSAGYNIIGSFSWCNIGTTLFGKSPLSRKIFSSRRLYFGECVSGNCVKRNVERVYDLFVWIRKNNRVCSDEYGRVDECLSNLQVAVNERVEEICLQLKQERVKLFITVNQYNLRDVLTIMACRRAKIWTKELSHYASCIAAIQPNKRDDLSFSDNIRVFAYVNESCQWSEADKEYSIKYNVFDAMYHDLQISVVGCPEITKDDYMRNISKYKRENSLVLFVPTAETFLGFFVNKEICNVSKERTQDIMRQRKELYQKVAYFSKKNGVKVYIRYHPTEQQKYIEPEKNLLRSLNFEVMSPSREDFIKAICKSKIALGCMTSAFISALIYGCKCYTLIFNTEEQYDFCGMDVTRITVDEITNIIFESSGKCIENGYIDIERLCTYPEML